jgi:hypothetical protein
MDRSEAPGRSGVAKPLRLACLVALPVLAVIALAWQLHRPLDTVPMKLRGIWRTEADSHRDRFLAIEDRSISFGTGGHDALVYGVLGVEFSEESRTETRYRFHVIDAEGARDEVVVTYRQESPLPSLMLKHQAAVWRPHLLKPGDAP